MKYVVEITYMMAVSYWYVEIIMILAFTVMVLKYADVSLKKT